MTQIVRAIGAVVIFSLAGTAAAHTGHDTSSLMSGLQHPFGPDHLLAMIAVGIWSAAALPARRRVAGPAIFMLALVLGALLGATGSNFPGLEFAVAASVIALGVLLVFARQIHLSVGLGLIAAAATLHGVAHGAELPVAGTMGAYVLGFLITTAALHASGLGLGRALLGLRNGVWQSLGTGVGLAGALLLARV